MPVRNLRGININYEILGEEGAWVALSPGGRRGLEGARGLGEKMAARGYRVVLFDRRNCGATDVVIGGNESEYEIWADDLHALLTDLGALPTIVGGGSSGCRLAILLALRNPRAVRALLLWRVTGGAPACKALADKYYGEYVRAAVAGGMEAVCDSEHFAECIQANPANRDLLMAIDTQDFVTAMNDWAEYFLAGKDLPIIGATESDLRSIQVPACVVPGNDRQHPAWAARTVTELVEGSELHDLVRIQRDVDLGPIEDWEEIQDDMASVFDEFVKRTVMVPTH